MSKDFKNEAPTMVSKPNTAVYPITSIQAILISEKYSPRAFLTGNPAEAFFSPCPILSSPIISLILSSTTSTLASCVPTTTIVVIDGFSPPRQRPRQIAQPAFSVQRSQTHSCEPRTTEMARSPCPWPRATRKATGPVLYPSSMGILGT